MNQLKTNSIALGLGLLFGLGLIRAGMIDTHNVKGFLDIAGLWKPALGLVMAAAIAIAAPLFYYAKRQNTPLWGDEFDTPPRIIDARLIWGSALFGLGWGLSGLCPGPAIVWLGFRPLDILPFIVTFGLGSALGQYLIERAK